MAPLQEAAPPSTRFVLVSATLPDHTFATLREAFPGLAPAFGPGLHRVSAGAPARAGPRCPLAWRCLPLPCLPLLLLRR